MESFEHNGRFWLPGQDDRQVAGVLSFDRENGGQLSLIGALHEEPIIGTPLAVDQLILGVAGRAEVTLSRCLLTSNPWHSPGWLEETWRPQMILRGAWLDDPDKLVFDNAYFEVDALLEWTNRARIERYRDDDIHGAAGVVIQHGEVAPEAIDLEDGGMLEIRFPWATEGDSVRESTVRQRCVIHRTWTQAHCLDDVLAEIRLFQHLLTFAVNEACSYRTITLQHPDVVLKRDDRIYREPIEFYAAPKGKSLAKVPHPVNMLFRLEDLGGIEGLRRWRDVASSYARVLNMATSIRYLPGIFGENKLANTTSAAEALHRLVFPGKAIDDDTYRPLKRAMLKTIPVDYRDHLSQQLRHANEHFLSTRLRELAAYAAPASEVIVADPSRWARLVATVRNSLTHPEDRGDDVDRPDVTGHDLLLLAESVYLVIALCVLREAGLSDEALVSSVQRMSVQWACKQIPNLIDRLWPLVEKPQ